MNYIYYCVYCVYRLNRANLEKPITEFHDSAKLFLMLTLAYYVFAAIVVLFLFVTGLPKFWGWIMVIAVYLMCYYYIYYKFTKDDKYIKVIDEYEKLGQNKNLNVFVAALFHFTGLFLLVGIACIGKVLP